VPPDAYGGVESVVGVLADALTEAGHKVTLFARADSATKAELAAVVSEQPSQPGRRIFADLEHALECFLRAGEFDLVNNHMGVVGAAAADHRGTPVVHTVSDPLDRTRDVWRKLARRSPEAKLISVSHRQQELAPDLPWIANCPNGLDLSRFRFRREAGAYLAFLGRMSPDKGCHRAIEVARRSGLPLKISAKMEEEHEREYFEECVRPHLDGDVEFVGAVDHDGKVDLLGGAIATLFPVEVEEAFGLVLAESMACGTPVVAFGRGAVPEVVADGRTGYVVQDEQQMVEALGRIGAIDRAECRGHVEHHFSAVRLAAAYEGAYRRALAAPV
jgi:glycosyltransferase involved in cell wall biosynthesis